VGVGVFVWPMRGSTFCGCPSWGVFVVVGPVSVLIWHFVGPGPREVVVVLQLV
jgi:hypothetical protein